jgi:transcriptional regulator with XRE-family HTH domain
MDNKSIIGRNISFIRNLNNLTQDKVADYLKINRSTYSNYEASLREPDVDVLLKLSSLFGCELSFFF